MFNVLSYVGDGTGKKTLAVFSIAQKVKRFEDARLTEGTWQYAMEKAGKELQWDMIVDTAEAKKSGHRMHEHILMRAFRRNKPSREI